MRRLIRLFTYSSNQRGQVFWTGLSVCALLVLLLVSFQNVSVCSGQEGLKKWLPKMPNLNKIQYTTDKRVVKSMLASLKLREEELNRKEQEIAESQKSLDHLKALLKERMAEIEKVRKDAEAMIAKAEAKKDMRIDNLVSVCGTMTSENAAAMFLELFKKDRELLTTVFAGLNKKRTAAILNEITVVSPSVAADISLSVGRLR
ncbi:hypothetical protein J7M28_01650 [bacterium]|nr:hypothetical protein [bacterium]